MIRMIVLLLALLGALGPEIAQGEERPPTWVPSKGELASRSWIPGPDEVIIAYDGIAPPLGRILLARTAPQYCAIKFTDTWLGETYNDHYSSYEFYYQGDGSGDFTRSNVVSGTGELFFPKIEPLIFFSGYQKGRKNKITCGGMEFEWVFTTYTYIGKFELAPTPWVSINEVNVQDPRLRWYKKDSDRKKKRVPIDKLWEDAK